jgi:hypothetical protein
MEHERQLTWQVTGDCRRTMGYILPRSTFKYEVHELVKNFLNATNQGDISMPAFVRRTMPSTCPPISWPVGIESWVEIHNSPGETERLVQLLWHLKGVDILTARDPDRADQPAICSAPPSAVEIPSPLIHPNGILLWTIRLLSRTDPLSKGPVRSLPLLFRSPERCT